MALESFNEVEESRPAFNTSQLSFNPRETSTIEEQRPVSQTARVRPEELYELLRLPAESGETLNSATADVPVIDSEIISRSSELKPRETISPHGANARIKRSPSNRRKEWIVSLLLVAVIGASLTALNFSRRQIRSAQERQTATSQDSTAVNEHENASEESLLRSVIEREPANADAHRALAGALERNGQLDEAIEHYRIAYELDPSNEAGLVMYSDALSLAGRVEEASAIRQSLTSNAGFALASFRSASGSTGKNGSVRDRVLGNELLQLPATQLTPSDIASIAPKELLELPTEANVKEDNTSSYELRPNVKYFNALRILDGRKAKEVPQAELLHALRLFQEATVDTSHGSDAARRAEELGKEYDKRRKKR